MANLLKWPLRILRRKLWKIGSLSANPYATHIPVLVACARLFKPARVLELGSGQYSTPLFLNTEIFPEVVHVRSLENDRQWYDKLDHLRDPRLERLLVSGAMHDAIADIDCSDFDLIFVDDSASARERKRTLDTLRRKILGSQVVVVHDFDLWPIRLAVYSYPKYHGMLGLTPQCGVAWNKRIVCRRALRKFDDVLRAFRARIREDDPIEWRNRFIQSIPDGK